MSHRIPHLALTALLLLAPAALVSADEPSLAGATVATPSDAAATPSADPAGNQARPSRGKGRARAWWAPVSDRGWLGVRLGSREQLDQALKADTLPEEWMRVLNTRWLLEEWDGAGALVSEVFTETPAEKAGLLPGDVVVSFNGIRTGSAGELSFVVQRALKGRDGDLEVLRDGEVRRILVEIGLHPEDARRIEEEEAAKRMEQAREPGTAAEVPVTDR